MSDVQPADLDLCEAAAALRSGHLTSEELTRACLARIQRRDTALGAWIQVYEDRAMEAAREADRRIQTRRAGPLTGIPIGLKDVIGVKGLPLTADSPVLKGNVASVDSTAWARLEAQGMVLLGHLHCGEFACGSWGANPWNRDFSSGGSSSGSGIAVASRTVPVTLGSDGRGSIRIPSSHNGVTGFKPTFGLISTFGCIPITFSYDVLGPMARSAADCATMMNALVGRDPADPTTLSQPDKLTFPVQARGGSQPLNGKRLGVPRFRQDSLAPGIETVFTRGQDELERLGATLVPFERPENPLEENGGVGPGWLTILGAEAQVIHEQFAGREDLHRPDFSVLFNPMTEHVGTAVDYVKAQIKRSELITTWTSLFADLRLDAVVEPLMANEIWRVGPDGRVDLDPTKPFRSTFYPLWNDVNFPVTSVPAGLSPTDGGPVSLQIVGLPYSDPSLLQMVMEYQAATNYHELVPQGLDDEHRGPYNAPVRPDGGPQPTYQPLRSPYDAIIPAPGLPIKS